MNELDRITLPSLALPIIAVLRAPDAGAYGPVIAALLDAGITGIELTMTTPGTLAALASLREASGTTAVIGVGTVTRPREVEQAAQGGAAFIVTPVTDLELIAAAHRCSLPIVPGGFTPSELHAAWRAGASAVKLFPAATVGPTFVRHLHGPFPDLEVIPSGGVAIDDAADWLQAGAVAVSVGGPLVGDALRGGSIAALRERARRLACQVRRGGAP